MSGNLAEVGRLPLQELGKRQCFPEFFPVRSGKMFTHDPIDFYETIRAGLSLSYRVAKDRWKMSFEYWYATSPEGRVVKYGYKELSDGVAAISATVEGRALMILQKSLRAPLTRTQVEALFEDKSTIRDLTEERLTDERHQSSASCGN
jgi:hypothetical protein